MKRNIYTKKKITLLFTCYMTAVTVVLGSIILLQSRRAEQYMSRVKESTSRAYGLLTEETEQMERSLRESVYAGAPSLTADRLTEAYINASAARRSLETLNVVGIGGEGAAEFADEAGQYAKALAKKAAEGNELSAEECDRLIELAKKAAELRESISDGKPVSFSMEKEDAAKLLESKGEITVREAASAAAGITGIRQNTLKYEGEYGGSIPVYRYGAKAKGADIDIEVTKAGGYIALVRSTRKAEDRGLSQEEAVKSAERIVRENGFRDMKVTGQNTKGGTVKVEMAYSKDGVIYYPDSISVCIGRDDGGLVSIESRRYIMNHHMREPASVTVKEAEARTKVSGGLTVQAHNMAVIADAARGEIYCHEYQCKGEGDEYYRVYINAETSVEERIELV